MSLLVVGLSHRTAAVRVLERATVPADATAKLLAGLMKSANVSESLLLSTCNRVEVYAVVETFHGGMAEVIRALAEHADADVAELSEHLYVHYAGAAVEHAFTVAAGLDSMVVGESQVLGQLRAAYATAAAAGAAGRTLHELAQQALRVGKRVHTETGIDAAGASVVAEALADAAIALREAGLDGLAGRRAVLIGAGSMGALAAAHLRRAGVASLTVVNRSLAPAQRLAQTAADEGITASAVELTELACVLAGAELLVSCTGSVSAVLDEATLGAARAGREHPLAVCDLGLPRDVTPGVAQLPGVTVIDLATLQRRLSGLPAGEDVVRARAIVAEELSTFLAAQRAAAVTPTVTALRQRAAEVVAAELLRMEARLPGLDTETRAELAKTVHRVVDKLLHTPTVRIKELAAGAAGQAYTAALRELFDLDPGAPAALVQPTEGERQ